MSEISAKEAVEIIAVVAGLRVERDRLAAEAEELRDDNTWLRCLHDDMNRWYGDLWTARKKAEARITELEAAIRDIKKHMEISGGSMAKRSSIYRLAKAVERSDDA